MPLFGTRLGFGSDRKTPASPDSRRLRDERGFTLPELLTVVTIIGLLSTIGVVSYDSARRQSRDVKRVSDAKQIQSAIEFYFENHSSYPGDGFPGDEGLILGVPATKTLSDIGFAPMPEGTVFMIGIPQNPQPGGTPYVYRSIETDGSNCNSDKCGAYVMIFTLEGEQGSYVAGTHAITTTGITGASGGSAGAGVTGASSKVIGAEGVQAQIAATAAEAALAVAKFAEDARVEAVAEVAIAPVATAAVVTTTALSTTSVASYGAFLLTQPFVFFGLRRRKKWGTVYNAYTKVGADLVIVRLRDASTGRVVKSTVTDGDGRFSFLAPRGTYRLDINKAGLTFPSPSLAGVKEDGPYSDLYHGEVITVSDAGGTLTPSLPVEPTVVDAADHVVVKRNRSRRLREFIAGVTPVIGALALAIKPTILTGLLFAAQAITYMLFRRLAAAKEPKNWGIVYDQATSRPVPQAIARVFEAKYNKLLETQVTDRQGRYHFRVGGNVYFLTVTKPGYEKTETDRLDLTAIKEPTVIASDLPLKRSEAQAAKTIETPPAPESPKEPPPVAQSF